MMTSVLTPLLHPVGKSQGPSATNKSASPAGTPLVTTASTASVPAENLAGSIMADGGLGFLQARMQEKMEELFGAPESAQGSGHDGGQDQSPEATADRIVSFALSLRSVYERQNEGLSQEEMTAGFEHAVRRGISEGFGHAQGVLSGLGLLEGEVQDNVDLTWDLIQQKLGEIFNPQVPTP